MAKTPPKETTAEHERRAWELRTTKFYTHQQIADDLGVERSTVTKMLGRLEKKAHAEYAKQREAMVARQLAQLDTLAGEAFMEWERSKLPAENERVVTKAKVVTDGSLDAEHDEPAEEEFQEITRETRGRIGDAQLLNQVRGALADQRKLLGLEAPVERRLTGKDGGPVEVGLSFEAAVKLLISEGEPVTPMTKEDADVPDAE